MDLTIREAFSLAGAIIVLAGLAVVVANGKDFANILTAAGSSFAGVISAATAPARR